MAKKANLNEPLPYYTWRWRDYRANRKVQRMGWQAKGLYRELLDEFWAEGVLPLATCDLADICGCPLKEFEKFWSQIEPCWDKTASGYVNRKMDEQRTAADQARVAMSRGGHKGGVKSNSSTRSKGMEAYPSSNQAPASILEAQVDIAIAIAKQEQEHCDQPDPPEEIFDADMVATAVMTECGLGRMPVRMAIEQVARVEISNKGAAGQELARTMSERWREYEAAKPQLEYASGPEKFFGDGTWRTPESWPWKDGRGPAKKRKYLETAA